MVISRVLSKYEKRETSSELEFRNKVSFPKIANWIFDKFMRIDELLIQNRISLPVGGTLFIIAKKQR